MGELRPYYADPAVRLYLGDCREILPRLDLSGVSVVVADPPYGETSLQWDVPVTDWLPLVEQVGYVWCFGSLRMFMAQAADFRRWKLSHDVIWRKQGGTNFAADRFRRFHEQIALFYRGRWDAHYHQPVRIPREGPAIPSHVSKSHDPAPRTGDIRPSFWSDNGTRLHGSILEARNSHRTGAVHRTQKPEPVVGPLVSYSCPPGGTVLEPFGGAAPAAVWAKKTGRQAIVVELDQATCAKAAARLAQETLGALIPTVPVGNLETQGSLFDDEARP